MQRVDMRRDINVTVRRAKQRVQVRIFPQKVPQPLRVHDLLREFRMRTDCPRWYLRPHVHAGIEAAAHSPRLTDKKFACLTVAARAAKGIAFPTDTCDRWWTRPRDVNVSVRRAVLRAELRILLSCVPQTLLDPDLLRDFPVRSDCPPCTLR